MSENKFTPGPWETGDDYQVQTVDKHGYEIAEMRIDVPEYEANARLIAAAPDLLEALEAVLLVVGQLRIGEHLPCDQGMNVTKLCMAAIAKARGEV